VFLDLMEGCGGLAHAATQRNELRRAIKNPQAQSRGDFSAPLQIPIYPRFFEDFSERNRAAPLE
jgi:hypothetical protein